MAGLDELHVTLPLAMRPRESYRVAVRGTMSPTTSEEVLGEIEIDVTGAFEIFTEADAVDDPTTAVTVTSPAVRVARAPPVERAALAVSEMCHFTPVVVVYDPDGAIVDTWNSIVSPAVAETALGETMSCSCSEVTMRVALSEAEPALAWIVVRP
jgi:hypothetical protein